MLKFIQKNLIDTTRLTPEEKWEKATIANNFIFYKIMQNNHDVCKELLEILTSTHGNTKRVMGNTAYMDMSHIVSV